MDHTPTPWFVDGRENTNVTGANEVGVADTYAESGDFLVDQANAAFIVTACNAHDALVAALDDILDYRGGADSALDDEYVMDRAVAALALARGEVQP